jgi:hypothetical protein
LFFNDAFRRFDLSVIFCCLRARLSYDFLDLLRLDRSLDIGDIGRLED